MTWYSQAGQDEWVQDLIGDVGYFVDVGAHDGVTHSNTYALEQAGWTGLCIEPEPLAYASMVRHRGCCRLRVVVSDHAGLAAFDGIRVGAGSLVECLTLAAVLTEAEAPPVIDYLSVDVEGHELEVLAGMDFDRWTVRLITIEHNLYCDGPVRKDAIFEVLTGYGFERVVEDVVAKGYGPFEDWYRHV